MQGVAAALQQAAGTDVRVVLYGEPGTGKSFAAATLHRLSRRQSEPLKHVSVRGQRAVERLSAPAVRAAKAGTLVLEGVHEASSETQAMLAGLLEEWSAAEERGESAVRVVATTETSLAAATDAGRFRTDLFYLLAVLPVSLPPLRRRGAEIPALVVEFARRAGADPETLPAVPITFLERALSYSWPGNLRELAGLVQRALPRSGGAEWHFPPLLNPVVTEALVPPFHTAKREFEQSYVQRLLLLTQGNVSRAAELAGKARKDFYALLSRTRVDPALFRAGAGE